MVTKTYIDRKATFWENFSDVKHHECLKYFLQRIVGCGVSFSARAVFR